MTKQRVLVLCTGNSCRSQMAEGMINAFAGDRWHAESAGTQPAGYVHPTAVEAMAELGVDLAGSRSKSTEEFRGQAFDLVITVCGDADENCPAWLGSGQRVHIGFPDPAKVTGDAATVQSAFRAVRDDIRRDVLIYLNQFESQQVEHLPTDAPARPAL